MKLAAYTMITLAIVVFATLSFAQEQPQQLTRQQLINQLDYMRAKADQARYQAGEWDAKANEVVKQIQAIDAKDKKVEPVKKTEPAK